jgi:DNA-binding IclR family transcriptional regulator
MATLDGDQTANPASGVRAARRALDLLSLLSATRPTLTLKLAVEESGLPRTTVLRLLETLQQSGLLWPVGPHTYVAGPTLLRWAALSAHGWQLPPGTQQTMRQLADHTGETVSVYVRYDVQRVCIAAEEGTQALRHVARVGSEQPLWAGAPAKILLSGAPPSLLVRVAALSPKGASHMATLERWCQEARRDGWALSHNEREDGLSAVAVPVTDSNGHILATVSLAGPTPRFQPERVESYREQLLGLADQMRDSGFENVPGLDAQPRDRQAL